MLYSPLLDVAHAPSRIASGLTRINGPCYYAADDAVLKIAYKGYKSVQTLLVPQRALVTPAAKPSTTLPCASDVEVGHTRRSQNECCAVLRTLHMAGGSGYRTRRRRSPVQATVDGQSRHSRVSMSFSDVGRGLHRRMLGHISLTRIYEQFFNKQAPPDQ